MKYATTPPRPVMTKFSKEEYSQLNLVAKDFTTPTINNMMVVKMIAR
jgi:hypothetical protein